MKKTMLIVIGSILLCAGPLIVLTGTAYTLMLPNIYESTARISVNDPSPVKDCENPCPHCFAVNSNYIKVQMLILQSKPVLYEVIKQLDLQSEWGRGGDKLPREVAYLILKNSISVSQYKETSLMAISVRRNNPTKAAKLANAVAETYRDYCIEARRERTRVVIDRLKDALMEQKDNVRAAENKVEHLRGSQNNEMQQKAFQIAHDERETERHVYNEIKTKLRTEIIVLEVPQVPVEIIDIAEPNVRPVSPNLFMNVIISLGLAAVATVAGIVMLVWGIRKKT